jgi:hypothetical protein
MNSVTKNSGVLCKENVWILLFTPRMLTNCDELTARFG